MTNALPWAVVISYCLHSTFINYQQLHAKHFRGASETFLSILVLSGFVGMVTGFVFLLYYGLKVAWWAPLILLVLSFVFKFVSFQIEDRTGPFAISLLGFIGWPVCAFIMFSASPSLDTQIVPSLMSPVERNLDTQAISRPMFPMASDRDDQALQRETITQFVACVESANLATGVVNRGTPFSPMPEEDADEMMRHYRNALAHAQKVDVRVLNDLYEGWGTRLEDGLLAGLRLVVEGDRNADALTSLAGQKLLDSWGDWFNDNVNEIRKAR